MKLSFNKIEKLLLFLFSFCFILLSIIQFITYKNNNGIYIYNVGIKNKSLPFFDDNELKDKGIIILKNMTPNYKNIKILLNGEPVGEFSNDEVQIHVSHNDIIEIDGTKYNNHLKVKVIGISSNIETPKLNTIITTFQSIEILGKVRLK
ncbi:hypothetical protein EDD65_102322 [Keratinibaculum paraultunense]|uniref:Uncharacterized protein n=1 Tax=Keratinibaculum paraultunense TaxID=1278232 RepID=A0A4R3L1B1_9FIRM|nr:hypothetical protein [Keratinibaculum paraultunense]QQY80652.1 hypothetical protein JL105_04975 [Keratinibaculum paraultunense]TCS91387.1 hypothetical protein EDD65_102322 [Keratinibaculum paraultunense]